MPFPIQNQAESQWCWAAVAVSIERFFSPNSKRKQCELAATVLGENDCCTQPEVCNKAWYLQDALSTVGNLNGTAERALSFEEIQKEIDAKRPPCVRIAWYGGGAHFVVITGYRVSLSGKKKFLDVADPFYRDSTLTYSDFTYAYQSGSGYWTDTYYVHP